MRRAGLHAESIKGPTVSGQALDFIGGAKRDRTADLYNAIVAVWVYPG
jgi:hypothetical protein